MEKEIKKYFHSSPNMLLALKSRTYASLKALGEHAFLVMLLLFLANMIFGQVLLYQYFSLVAPGKAPAADTVVILKENLYFSILQKIQTREETYQNFLPEARVNPFR